MFKKMTYLMLVTLILGLAHIGWATTKIIIVTNDPGTEASYTSFLTNLLGNDITVEAVKDKYIDPLSAAAKADLSAANLVIVSRKTSSGKFVADIKFWNSLAAPVLLHSSFLIGDDRWRWMPNGTENQDITRVAVVDGTDPVFNGVAITDGQVQISDSVIAGLDLSNQDSAGNGTKIATPSGNNRVLIARWAAGTEYYPGSGQIAGGPRLFFGMRTDQFIPVVNDNGKKMLGNAILSLLGKVGPVPKASNPNPANAQVDVVRDVVLSWTPGMVGTKHDVYLGTVSQSVSDASRANPQGVLVGPNISGDEYDPIGLLEFGRAYYWRVDEINGVDFKISKGDVWSFTTEPYAYPIKDVAATASGSQPGMGPEKTIDGSGLNGSDQHSIDSLTMWLSAGAQPTWIQYQFDKVYKLSELWVWNSNQAVENLTGFGARNVTVEYSADGITWQALTGVPEFARAPGLATYTHNTAVAFGGVLAKYVRLTINSSWGGGPQAGLSEVRFFYIPVQAREPQPATAQTNVAPDVTLTWRAGRDAALHQVYFGTDANALTLAGTTAQASFVPSVVNLGTTYYWRIDEVNATQTPSIWTGSIWSFSTREYTIIDDMESYNDQANKIFDTWVDGYGTTTNGSQVGYGTSMNGTFGETVIVHGGKQSMPFNYDNAGSISSSEATRTWDTAQNWAANGANTLSLWFRGNPIGFLALASDHILMNGVGTDIFSTADQGRFVYKQLTGNSTIVARVDRLDATDPWAKAGVMVRRNLDPGSIWAFSLYAPGNGFHFQTRLTTGGAGGTDSTTATAAQMAVRAPVWIKLERNGNVFNAYYATVNAPTTWIGSPSNPQTIAMADPVYIGLAVTSHSATAVTQAEFSAISTTGNVTGQWQSVDLGVSQPAGNTLDSLYVTLKDSVGKSTTIKHPDDLAVTGGVWQQWTIPFSSLTGVSTGKIKSLVIGVGDRTNPKHGKGLVYIDDIQFGHPAQ